MTTISIVDNLTEQEYEKTYCTPLEGKNLTKVYVSEEELVTGSIEYTVAYELEDDSDSRYLLLLARETDFGDAIIEIEFRDEITDLNYSI